METKTETKTESQLPVGVIPITPPVPQTSAAVINPEVVTLVELGKKAVVGQMMVGETFLEIVLHIRKNGIPDKLASAALKSVGFHKARVAELLKVAGAPAATFDAYAARTIGFKKALTITRDHLKALGQVSEKSVKELADNPPPLLEYLTPEKKAAKEAEVVEGVPGVPGGVSAGLPAPSGAKLEEVTTPEQRAALMRVKHLEHIKQSMGFILNQAITGLRETDSLTESREGWVITLSMPIEVKGKAPKGKKSGKEAKK